MDIIDVRIQDKTIHELTAVLLKLQSPFNEVVAEYSKISQIQPLDLTKYMIDSECYDWAIRIVKGYDVYALIPEYLKIDVDKLIGKPIEKKEVKQLTTSTICNDLNRLLKNLTKHWYNSSRIKKLKEIKLKEFKSKLIEISGVAPNDVLDFIENLMQSIKKKSVNYLEQTLNIDKLIEVDRILQNFLSVKIN